MTVAPEIAYFTLYSVIKGLTLKVLVFRVPVGDQIHFFHQDKSSLGHMVVFYWHGHLLKHELQTEYVLKILYRHD